MQLVRDTHIDFMKYRKFWIVFSIVFMIPGFVAIFFPRFLNLGIDFAGGTQMHLRFAAAPEVDRLRTLLEGVGLGETQIQRFGSGDANEVILKSRVDRQSQEGSRDRIEAALDRTYNAGKDNRTDLNRVGSDAVGDLLLAADPDQLSPDQVPVAQVPESVRTHYTGIAQSIFAERRRAGIFASWEQVGRVQGVSPAVVDVLKRSTHLGHFAVLGIENVGPQIGRELRQQGFWAVVLSLLGMLAYIAFRFELRFGIGAVVASLHDVLVTLGLFVLMKLEFNLTTVAAFLTLVGYSVNDTVVIFDRMRENMRKNRRRPLIEIMNESLNETLSRTIMTSGLTLLTVVALLALAGDVLRGFAFVMTIGILVGTYSSIYIASPFALLWERYISSRKGGQRRGGGGAAEVAEDARPVSMPKPRPAPGQRSRAGGRR